MQQPVQHTHLLWHPVWIAFLIFFVGYILPAGAQNPFHITNYTKAEYRADNQNWGIDLDPGGNLFIANNKGLLILKGSAFGLYELPARTPLRSVTYIDEKVFTGSFEEFGYWETGPAGSLTYHSLVSLLKDDTLKDDEIWKIVEHGPYIYFQSFGKLLRYDRQMLQSIPTPGPMMFLLDCGGRLFTQRIDGGLYEIVGDSLAYIEGSTVFNDTEVKAVLKLSDDEILIGTSSKGLYRYDGTAFTEWPVDDAGALIGSKLNNGIRAGNMLIFGTIMKGIYVFSPDGRLLYHFHTGNGLQNNTVLSLHSDTQNNLWACLDKGFDYIAFDTPFDTYAGEEVVSGTVYAACLFDDLLYVGTNQGIYYYRFESNGRFSGRQFLEGSQGQVWFIKVIDGGLYCGLNDGTYLIHEGRLNPVSQVSGGFNLQKIMIQNEEHLIQSSYYSLVVYRKQDGVFHESHVINGFEGPARFLEVDHIGNIWLGHTISGIYKVQPDDALRRAVDVVKMDKAAGLKENTNRVFKVDNRIVVPSSDRLLQWDPVKNALVPFDEIVPQLEGFETARTIIPASANRYWFVRHDQIGMFEIRFGKAKLLYRLIPEMYGLNMVENYENIVSLNDSLHLVCLENGFSILNLHRLNRLADNDKPVAIREVHVWKNPDRYIKLMPDLAVQNKFKHGHNNVKFLFTAQTPVGKKNYFQYMLPGIDTDWSEWTTATEVTYNRLPPGTYSFMVRSLTNKGMITTTTRVVFRVRPAWFLSSFSLAIYVMLLAAAFWLVRMKILRRHWRKLEASLREEQEQIRLQKELAESEVIRLSNEKLQSEISLKNSQLANNTMSIIRKNELLKNIQLELNRQRQELGARLPKTHFMRINKLIENSFKSDHDWDMFEKLFDQAHENFFQRLKNAYPSLTSSDLRLCAYLRLNLASKEIAPLLNISIRGVEERRYRLRKRLNLASDQNLTEFILSF